jgi:hypothetical protein
LEQGSPVLTENAVHRRIFHGCDLQSASPLTPVPDPRLAFLPRFVFRKRIAGGDITPMLPLPHLVSVMNSPRSWLALTAALGFLALIAWHLPQSAPPPLSPAPQTFDVMSTSVTWHLDDDPPQLGEGQMVGELHAPKASGKKSKPANTNPPARRKADRDQTRAAPLPERATLAG